jgi:hypothetical protein
VPCLSFGTGNGTLFRLRATGYQSDLGKIVQIIVIIRKAFIIVDIITQLWRKI